MLDLSKDPFFAHLRQTEGMTLGELIDALKAVEPSTFERWAGSRNVCFDFCGLVPDVEQIDSYRGYYEQLAIGWKEPEYSPTADDVAPLIKALEDAVGQTFEGYKGGDYVMSRDTPIWVSKYGENSGTRIVGVSVSGSWATIHTAQVED